MKDFFEQDKLPSRLRNTLAPGKEFAKKSRGVFLALFENKFMKTVPRNRFSFAFRTILAVVAIIGFTNILAAYADNQSVNPTSPLYPLKRYHESLVLAFASSNDKPQLQIQMAEERLNEIEAVNGQSNNKNNGEGNVGGTNREDQHYKVNIAVAKLENDAEDSLLGAEKDEATSSESGVPAFCNPLNKLFINSTSSHLRGILGKNPKILQKFGDKCDGIASSTNNYINSLNDSGNTNATTTYNIKGNEESSGTENPQLINGNHNSENTKVETENNKNNNDD
ncbi:MAG: hypothetical protein KGJ89_02695 [Patescibacteria group bacterium]|nr:hypothetical protein [Patescibacteria group bacterium]MDE2015787.1 hypothetical protein [Patescibacteria group bacterium]MDE2226844.1 hypothetical protein [Patescibacteria group bacterium]